MEFKQEPFEDAYEVGEDIGSGQFAVVRRCKHKTTKVVYAGKFIRKKRVKSSRRGVLLADIQREVAILQEIDHENIIKLYEVYETKQEVILVLELVSGGELFDYMAERDKVSEDEAVGFLVQILQGTKHMHHKNIVHLDLKPENVMLLEPKSNKIKLIDFGLSRKLKPGEDIRELLGTPEFVAPEVINYDPLSTATDMWSVGVLTYILLSGYSPFLGDDKQETFSNVSSGQFSLDNKYFDSTSDLAKDFIQKLLIQDTSKRATVEGCLEHPWIKPRGKKDLVIRKSSSLNIQNLKSYLARKRWKHTIRVIQLCNRLKKSAAIKRRAREAMHPSSTVDPTDKDLWDKPSGIDSDAVVLDGIVLSSDTLLSSSVTSS